MERLKQLVLKRFRHQDVGDLADPSTTCTLKNPRTGLDCLVLESSTPGRGTYKHSRGRLTYDCERESLDVTRG